MEIKKPLAHALCAAALTASALEPDAWRAAVPAPVLDAEPDLVALYWTAWEKAHGYRREQPGLPQNPYMWPGAWTNSIWIWDTSFMVFFCRYAPGEFPALESLRNFYVGIHGPFEGAFPLNIQHPDNPPLFAWAEWEAYRQHGDDAHVRKLLLETRYLQRHVEWFDTVERGWRFPSASDRKASSPVRIHRTEKGYLWNRYPSGMDNTPRGRGADHEILWVDALAQQGLSALCIARLANAVGERALADEWRAKYEALKQTVNDHYWCEEDGIYYDVDSETLAFSRVKTPASFWPMLAGMCSLEQARRMLAHAMDENVFGGERPWPSVSRDDPVYVESLPDGRYWRGAVWAPTAYVGIKALAACGYHEEADQSARNLLEHYLRTYRGCEPHALWEAHSPSRDAPATAPQKKGRPDRIVREYVGWSSLPPTALFIEHVLGFHRMDAAGRSLAWRLRRRDRHGIERLRFGDIETSLVAEGTQIHMQSSAPYMLVVNDVPVAVPAGSSRITLDNDASEPRPSPTKKQWIATQRPALLEWFRRNLYGRNPIDRPEAMRFRLLESAPDALDGLATRKQVRIDFTGDPEGPGATLLLYLPNANRGKPAPVFLGLNARGNQTVHPDPAILESSGWSLGVEAHPERGRRGAASGEFCVETLLARGCALATLHVGELDPDQDDGFRNGVHAHFDGRHFPDGRPGDAWGSIAAWAWGLSRALDYLETDPRVDRRRLAVFGLSRRGKAALWCGAQDERVALTVPCDSGGQGTPLTRVPGGTNSIRKLNDYAPHWFCENWKRYNDRDDEVPVDQDRLIALVAPRRIYVATASEDPYAPPIRDFRACAVASPVWSLFNLPGLVGAEMPRPGDALQEGSIGFHVRQGGHDLLPEDWARILDYADRIWPERIGL